MIIMIQVPESLHLYSTRPSAIVTTHWSPWPLYSTSDYPSQVILDLEDNQIVAYCNLASFVVLAYNISLTLASEVELVWHTPWSLGKILYFATRYPAMIDTGLLAFLPLLPSSTTPVVCAKMYGAVVWMLVAGMFVSELVLVFRTWAIWGKSNRVAITLLALIVTMTIPIGVFTHLGTAGLKFVVSPAPRKSCWIDSNLSPIAIGDYIIVLLFESVILSLTVFKGRQHLRFSNANLFVTLYRDGVLYYAFLVLCTLANIVVMANSKQPPD
ncbi:hypothetical protein JB92DRAFT_2896880 [Gautieria morchelliformis]|nr:hypothetical protein JB92DRAFT_2896880 [Gautieria morchelliformis]